MATFRIGIDCPLCRTPLPSLKTDPAGTDRWPSCRHRTHAACALAWRRTNSVCPVCKKHAIARTRTRLVSLPTGVWMLLVMWLIQLVVLLVSSMKHDEYSVPIACSADAFDAEPTPWLGCTTMLAIFEPRLDRITHAGLHAYLERAIPHCNSQLYIMRTRIVRVLAFIAFAPIKIRYWEWPLTGLYDEYAAWADWACTRCPHEELPLLLPRSGGRYESPGYGSCVRPAPV